MFPACLRLFFLSAWQHQQLLDNAGADDVCNKHPNLHREQRRLDDLVFQSSIRLAQSARKAQKVWGKTQGTGINPVNILARPQYPYLYGYYCVYTRAWLIMSWWIKICRPSEAAVMSHNSIVNAVENMGLQCILMEE